MVSLKSFIPALAAEFDMKPAAIYERQRALVRAGLIEQRPGHGPGSGVLATPYSLAMLLISITVTAHLSEVEQQTKMVASLKSRTKRCPFTGQTTFAQALTEVLRNEDLYKRFDHIRIERGGDNVDAAIAYHGKSKREKPGKEKESAFGEKRAVGHYLWFLTFLAMPDLSRLFAVLTKEASK